MRSPSLMFGGIPIYASDLLANTKTIRWKTERNGGNPYKDQVIDEGVRRALA